MSVGATGYFSERADAEFGHLLCTTPAGNDVMVTHIVGSPEAARALAEGDYSDASPIGPVVAVVGSSERRLQSLRREVSILEIIAVDEELEPAARA